MDVSQILRLCNNVITNVPHSHSVPTLPFFLIAGLEVVIVIELVVIGVLIPYMTYTLLEVPLVQAVSIAQVIFRSMNIVQMNVVTILCIK